jgi:cytoskeletal protein CcmA (bactofilin family)
MENNAPPQSTIASEVEIKGTIKSSGSIRIDGKLDGELQCSGDAIVGKSATMKGNINVNSVTVEGTVHGNINAKDRIEMKSSARVTGDIKAKRLSVEDGVTFVGKSEVSPSGSPISTAPITTSGDEAQAESTEDVKEGAAAVRSFARR